MNKSLIIIILIFTINLLNPIITFSAEVLNVRSSSIVQLGDGNRNYKVRIACMNIKNSREKEATEWLRLQLPRHSKVNLFPKDYEDGLLISEVVKLKTGENIASSMLELGFDKSNYLP